MTTKAKFTYANLKATDVRIFTPNVEGEQPKIVITFDKDGKEVKWTRNLHKAASKTAKAVKEAKEKNAHVVESMQILGFEPKKKHEFVKHAIGKVANCALEEDNGYERVAFINEVHTHSTASDEQAQEILSDLI